MSLLDRFKKKKKEAADHALQNPKILEVNLIREETQKEFNWRRGSKVLGAALGVSLLIAAEFYFGLKWWQQDEEARLAATKADVDRVAQDVSDFRKKSAPLLFYRERTQEAGNLLVNHIYWTNFFSWLEKNTLSTVTFGGFTGKDDGVYVLSGVAGSYADVSWQAKVLRADPLTKKVDITTVNTSGGKSAEDLAKEAAQGGKAATSTSTSTPSFSFELKLEVNPEIFKK